MYLSTLNSNVLLKFLYRPRFFCGRFFLNTIVAWFLHSYRAP